MKSQSQENEILLSFADLKTICRKSKKLILLGAFLGAVLSLFFALMQPIQYTSKGTFLEKGRTETQMSVDSLAAGLLRGDSKERSAKVAIKSRKILEAVVQKLNLQAKLQKESPFPSLLAKIAATLSVVPKNLHTEYSLLVFNQNPIIDKIPSEIEVKSINYAGEVSLFYRIEFVTNENFVIYDPYKKIEVGKGSLGKPFKTDLFTLTLVSSSTNSQKGEFYSLQIAPISQTALQLSKNLKISNDFESKSFLELTLKYPTRDGATKILDAIMEGYREHLLDEHHKLVSAQVDYLHEREEEIDRQTTKLIEEKALHLSAPVHNLELLVATQQALNKKLLSNELKLKQLHNDNHENSWLYSIDDDSKHLQSIHLKISELQQDRQQSDMIIAALDRIPLTLAQSKPSSKDTKQFEGIDLETAKTLFAAYTQELHEIESQIAQYRMIAAEVRTPAFELSSLSSILKDSISQGIINSGNQLTLALKDQQNRTSKEIERLEKDLDLQKSFLESHLNQSNEQLGTRAELLKKLTRSIQQEMLGLLNQKILMGEKHLSDYQMASIQGLKQEEQIIRKQQEDLQLELKKVPQQWISEKLINLHLEANGLILQQIGNLIETKNIANTLDSTLSAPFDKALTPILPNSPHLLLFMLFGSGFGSFAVFCGLLARSAAKGIAASKENLCASEQHVSGELNKRSNNIDTLRRLTAYLCPQKPKSNVILLLLGKEKDYSIDLAKLLSKRNQRVLIISTDFASDADSKELPGLLQYLEKAVEVPKINSTDCYDIIVAGGVTEYGNELLKSTAFSQLLQQKAEDYSWIVVTSKAMPISAEAESLIEDFDNVAITIDHEKLHELQSLYFDNIDNVQKNITYVLKDEG